MRAEAHPSLPSSRPPWATEGRKLGRYRLGPSLGKGGMGEVFRAWDTLLDREVALKLLGASRPEALVRFMREAQLQARVNHPNVCRIFDVEVADGTPCIAMQLVAGPTLREAAPAIGRDEACEILAGVAQAMHAAHRLKLVHRDLKPSNILLERGPAGAWIPYVADFGLAKDLGEDLTAEGAVVGTPTFMAPEQRCGDGDQVGPATDIFALGATLCSVLDLERPLPGGGGGLAPRPGEPRVPRDLKRILRRCLEERPQDRYPTAAALAEDLRRFRDGEPLAADRAGWVRVLRKALRNHRAPAAALGAALVLGGAFAAWAAVHRAAEKRRTVLALRFSAEARDLEGAMAAERLHPPHDLAPLLDEMTEGLDRIRADMEALGPEARGPGNLALGRGYLSMRFLEPALAALEEAWRCGYHTPDTAYALAKVHCESYIRLKDEEQLGDIRPAPDRAAHHLAEARRFLARAQGATWEPPELCAIMLRIFEGDGEGALVAARALQAEDPAFYPAWLEEAYAWTSLGCQRLDAGDEPGALERFHQAETAALHARTVGRSDITGYLASLDWRLHWLAKARLRPAESLRVWTEAEGLVETVLAMRARYPRALSAMVAVRIGKAQALYRLGGDWRRELDQADAFLDAARPIPAYAWLLPVKRAQVARTRRELTS